MLTVDLTVPTANLSKDAMKGIREAASEYLRAASTDDEKMERARHLYWECPAIPAKLIAGVLWGDEKLGPDVAAWVGALVLDFCVCGPCGAQVAVRSRTARTELKKDIADGYTPACRPCYEKDAAEKSAAENERQQREQARMYQLQTMRYRDYLQTEEWQNTRQQKLRQAGYACQLCNSGARLNVHHRTYERRGCEYLNDLTVLCEACHAKFHDKLP